MRKTIKRKRRGGGGSLILFARFPTGRCPPPPPLNGTKRGETTKITLLPYRRHSTERPILYDFSISSHSGKGLEWRRRVERAKRREDSYVLYRFSDEYSRDLRFRFEKLINQWYTLSTCVLFRSKGDILIEKYLKRIVYLDVWEIR